MFLRIKHPDCFVPIYYVFPKMVYMGSGYWICFSCWEICQNEVNGLESLTRIKLNTREKRKWIFLRKKNDIGLCSEFKRKKNFFLKKQQHFWKSNLLSLMGICKFKNAFKILKHCIIGDNKHYLLPKHFTFSSCRTRLERYIGVQSVAT
jgi:hypothetical protein